MNKTKVDYCPQGVGKFTLVILPTADDYSGSERIKIVEHVRQLKRELMNGIGTSVGVMTGTTSFLEFFWGPELDAEKINQALNRFLENWPDLTIRFQGVSGFPPMGL